MKAILVPILAYGLVLQLAEAGPQPNESKIQKLITRNAVVVLKGEGVDGIIRFSQIAGAPIFIKGEIKGLKPGLHGLHIHEFGDTTNGCVSTGPHFNPKGMTHGGPTDAQRHAGDLGNVIADIEGTAAVDKTDGTVSLYGANSIIGRAVVVHADPDDLGKGGHELSKTTGNAGARVACGVIGVAKA